MATAQPARIPERFRIEERIGAGGMGEVFRATDLRLGRSVALKLLPERFASDPGRLHRFQQEARAASALNHPNLVTVYDAGVENGAPWIAMEYVQGQTLREILTASPASIPARILDIAVQAAEGLAAAHQAGIVHRDLKPENIMVTGDGLVKILDFGLAKLAAVEEVGDAGATPPTAFLTVPGRTPGTPGYMSPEQLTGGPVDYRSDQFALGAVLYELGTGVSPFRRPTASQTLAANIEGRPRAVREANPAVPGALAAVIDRCLSKDPAERWTSTAEIVAALKGQRAAAATQPPARRGWKAAAVAAIVTSALAAGGVYWFKGRAPARREPPLVAVRAFKNLSPDRENDYFSSGISEEIRNQLSNISSIRLLSRSAVDRYKEGENRILGAELRANRIVEGSVRISDGRLRISVQMLDPSSEQTLWSEQYDRVMNDALKVQGEVALRIATALQAALTSDERRRVSKRLTASPQAYDLYLRAKRIRSGDREKGPDAERWLKEAIDLDPGFAAAMAMLAYNLAYQSDAARADEALQWAQRAARADAESAQAHIALGMAYFAKGMTSKARLAYLRAVELDPNNGVAMTNLGAILMDLGQFEEALHWIRLSLERNPTAAGACAVIAAPLVAYQDNAATKKLLDFCEQRNPNSLLLHQFRVLLLINEGKLREALEMAKALHARFGKNLVYTTFHTDLAMVVGADDAWPLYEQSRPASLDPTFGMWGVMPESPRAREAWFALRRGDKQKAVELLKEAETVAMPLWESGVESAVLPIEIASIYAMRNDRATALKWMQRAYERGWRHHYSSIIDPMLENLRSEPEFQRLMAQMKSDIAKMRAESTEMRTLFETTLPSLGQPRK